MIVTALNHLIIYRHDKPCFTMERPKSLIEEVWNAYALNINVMLEFFKNNLLNLYKKANQSI